MTSRRVFLRDGARALIGLCCAPSLLGRTLATVPPQRKILVAIFQRGGVDGLNMVVPFGDGEYYRARPTIAIPRPSSGAGGALDLDGFFAFHPRLAPLHTLYKRNQLAIVHACGSPHQTRSHFDAQDYMESGTPGEKSTADGWLNRCLQLRSPAAQSPFRGVSLSPNRPRALQGPVPTLAMGHFDAFKLQDATLSEQFEDVYAAASDSMLAATAREAFVAMRILRKVAAEPYQPANGAQYPQTSGGLALSQISQVIKADVGLEIAYAEIGRWDTHINENTPQGLPSQLRELADAIAAMVTDLGDRIDDVVILTMSEFGRTVFENGTAGTDHGHGNAMMVIGGGVKGGKVYGTWPGLAVEQRLEGRDLAVTTDFRDVFGEVAVRHLGVPAAAKIFPGYAINPVRSPGLFA